MQNNGPLSDQELVDEGNTVRLNDLAQRIELSKTRCTQEFRRLGTPGGFAKVTGESLADEPGGIVLAMASTRCSVYQESRKLNKG